MSVVGNQENLNTNVLPLFSTVKVEVPDPLQELLLEAEAEAWDVEDEAPAIARERLLVSDSQFPDQSIYVLEKQLASLKENMARLKFYLTDMDDLLPR